MLKELEEIREALRDLFHLVAIGSPHTVGSIDKHEKSLAKLDRILNQDESEMVERVALSIVNYCQQRTGNTVTDSMGNVKDSGEIYGLAKAALRAVGLIGGE